MSNHGKILRATLVLGSASFIQIISGVIQVKFIALILGPIGVGIIGLYQNICGLTTTVAGCGTTMSAVREFALAKDDGVKVMRIYHLLYLLNALLGMAALVSMWLLRFKISEWVFKAPIYGEEIGCLGIVVMLMMIAGVQTSILQGLSEVKTLGKLQAITAIISCAGGVAIIYFLETSGILYLLALSPLVSVILGRILLAKKIRFQSTSAKRIECRNAFMMMRMGAPLMLASLVTLAGQLVVRVYLGETLGIGEIGNYQAASTISITYLGFILNGMSTDYLPRLTISIKENKNFQNVINDQIEMLMLMGGPAIIAAIIFSPIMIGILYSSEFNSAVEILRWQSLGDILKLISWPMGFILVAQGRGLLYIGTQLHWNIWFVASTFTLVPSFGASAVGIGYLIAYLAHLVMVRFFAWKLLHIKIEKYNIKTFTLILLASIVTFFLVNFGKNIGYLFTLAILFATVIRSILLLKNKIHFHGR